MRKEDITQKLKEAYKTVIGDEYKGEITEETLLRDEMGLSSVGMLYFVIVLENLFDVRFEGVGMEDFCTVGDVVGYISNNCKI